MEISTSRALEAEVKLAALHLDSKPPINRPMPQYLAVSEQDDEEPIELPCEEDGCLLMSTLQGQFPGASGLQYRNPESNTLRGIRLSEGRLFPPDCAKSFVCVFPKDAKTRRENSLDVVKEKKRWDKRRCTDLIVLGVPWRTTDEEMRRHFETYGPLVLCTIKRDPKSGESRGYGFIRFQEYDAQVMCVSNRHFIDGRWCDVKIPNSRQQEGQDNAEYNRKVFVGRLTEDITQEDLYQYFSQHGKVTDVFIPRPFRAFAFVTFADQDSAHAILGREHTIKSCTVCVGTAVPKVPHHIHHQQHQHHQHQHQQQQQHHLFPQHVHHHQHQPQQHQHTPFNSVYQAAIAAATYSNLQQHHPQQHAGTARFGSTGRNGSSRSGADPGSSLAQLSMLNPAVLAALGNMFSAGSSAMSSSRANLANSSRANDVTKAPGPSGFGPTFSSLGLQHNRPAIPSDDGHPEVGKGCSGY